MRIDDLIETSSSSIPSIIVFGSDKALPIWRVGYRITVIGGISTEEELVEAASKPTSSKTLHRFVKEVYLSPVSFDGSDGLVVVIAADEHFLAEGDDIGSLRQSPVLVGPHLTRRSTS